MNNACAVYQNVELARFFLHVLEQTLEFFFFVQVYRKRSCRCELSGVRQPSAPARLNFFPERIFQRPC